MAHENGKPTYFDCDPGVDDSLALGYLVASPAIDLVGVGTVCGNIGAEQGARNACDWLAMMGAPEVPVAVGAKNPSWGEFYGGALWIHGERGTGAIELPRADKDPIAESAPQLLISLAEQYGGELEIVAVGPLTNLADALRINPDLPSLIKKVTIMGGTAMHPGNISPVAEANIGNDPESARIVFEQPWFIDMAGLDVTMANTFEEEHRRQLLDSNSAVARAIGEEIDFYFDFHLDVYGRRCSALHDPLAAAIAAGGITPIVAPTVVVEVDDSAGPGRGQTVADLRGIHNNFPAQEGAHIRVMLDVGTDLASHLIAVLTQLP